MNAAQKEKRNFRNSKVWKLFRHTKFVEQKGLCFITQKKLPKGATLHHMDLDESHYKDLSHPENFVYLCKSMHEVIHTIWRYYKTDPTVIDRIIEILEMMKKLNPN